MAIAHSKRMLRYHCLVEQAKCLEAFSAYVEYPSEPPPEFPTRSGSDPAARGGVPVHPILGHEPYFNGIDPSINPLTDLNPEAAEAYAELAHTFTPGYRRQLRMSATFNPKPKI